LRFPSLLVACAFTAFSLAAQEKTPPAGSPGEPSGELTLERIQSLAISRSPEIAAAESELRAREGGLLQAGARPNPELAGTSENHGGDTAKSGGVQSTLQIEQRLELGGDRAARAGVAAAARDLARWDLESRRLDVAGRATRAYFDVLSAQRRMQLADDTVRLAEEVRSTVAARVEAGKVSPIEETRADVSLAAERIERDRAAAELEAARSRLAATWGSASARFDRVLGDLDAVPAIPTLDTVLTSLERNPDVARWTAEIAEREALLRVEQARAVPDVTVGGGYRHFELGTGAALVTATIPLPLFDRNRGAQIEARERIARAQHERRALAIRIRQLVEETHASLARAEREVRALREQVLPGAESVYAAVTEGYRLGKFGYMEVLDARRTLAGVRAQLALAQADLHRNYADLQRLTAPALHDTPNGEQQ
jgi:cobalt-zinc-cadmium efflux system outer membrane protein